jgi:hypothetical protein
LLAYHRHPAGPKGFDPCLEVKKLIPGAIVMMRIGRVQLGPGAVILIFGILLGLVYLGLKELGMSPFSSNNGGNTPQATQPPRPFGLKGHRQLMTMLEKTGPKGLCNVTPKPVYWSNPLDQGLV